MSALWVTKSAVTVPSASTYQVLISACARMDTAAIRTTGSAPRRRRDVPTTTNVRPTRSACSPESVYAHRRSTRIL